MVAARRTSDAPYVVLAGLQVLDVATTWVILANWSSRGEATRPGLFS